MTKHIPPVPPAGRSSKGPAVVPESAPTDTAGGADSPSLNTKQQGQQGNSAQNTTHQGLQQDR